MKAIHGERFNLGEDGLKVVKSLKSLLNILLNIQTMSDKSYKCHLALTRQITLHVKKYILYDCYFSLLLLFFNNHPLSLVDFHDMHSF
jgi:hypothetical protein